MLARFCLAASLFACGAHHDEQPTEPETFTPPSPLGCAAAGAYDYCFAFDGGTPLALRVALPSAAREGDVGEVKFHLEDGQHAAAVLNDVKFGVKSDREALVLYFQVYPGSYTIDVSIAGASGTTSVVDVGAKPVATSISLE